MKKTIAIVIMNVILNYLVFVFIIAELNPILWGIHSRGLLAYITIITTLLSLSFNKSLK
jgi:hypothetical protein